MSEAHNGSGLFKWACLAVATFFLSAVLWLLNDIRLHVRQAAAVVQSTGDTVNQDLPPIVERTRRATEVIDRDLPGVLRNAGKTTETLAGLAEDIRQIKALAGMSAGPRDKGVVAYATSVLDTIEKSGGKVGVKKTLSKGLKNLKSAEDWVRGERLEVLALTALGRSKAGVLQGIVTNKWGSDWWIVIGTKEPVKLRDWLVANHPPTRELK
jgi:hypothetical protein